MTFKRLTYGWLARYQQLRIRIFPSYLKYRYRERLSFKLAKKFGSIPKVPMNIFFETITRCCSHCKFCPASVDYDSRPLTLMPEEYFKKCIDELAEYCYKGIVGLWINNEPLLDKRIVKFVEYAAKRLPKADVKILTNGLLLTPKLGKKLLDAGLKTLIINNYSDACTIHDNVKKFMNEVTPYYPTKVIRLRERFLSEKLLNLAGWSPNNKKLVHLTELCDWPFTSMFITTNGNVSFCCNDFLFEEVMGNVHRQQLMDIWHGEKYNYVRRQLSIGNRSFSHLCKVCDACGFSYKWLDNPFDYFIIKYVIGDI